MSQQVSYPSAGPLATVHRWLASAGTAASAIIPSLFR